ncbi:putative subunit of the anaphase promoting complex [Auricularia subglabra TFB-10046 SS5]|nr:putative subunit of the anaphase promoting complex [Auricularia subglabra TFB-10046 SS5]
MSGPLSPPITPFRVLSAPELANNFYVSEIAWSGSNILAVGLGSRVFLWNAQTTDVLELCEYPDDYVTSVSWKFDSSLLAIGMESGLLHLWDITTRKELCTWSKHNDRVGALTWNSNLIVSGSGDRRILVNDPREDNYQQSVRLKAHRLEVCGLTYNVANGLLASGGNDNMVMVWDMRHCQPRPYNANGATRPLWTFKQHRAAVKALSWNPHAPRCLATGGGTQDRCLRFWDSSTGTLLQHCDTGAQVCAIQWSRTTSELVSSHGFSATIPEDLIMVFRYPSLSKVATLRGHTSRVLYLDMSPDCSTIVSGAGDETLRFWRLFPKLTEPAEQRTSRLDLFRQIR